MLVPEYSHMCDLIFVRQYVFELLKSVQSYYVLEESETNFSDFGSF